MKIGKACHILWDFVWVTALALIFAVGATTLVRPVTVSGNSMTPAIEEDGCVLISTVPYLLGTPAVGDVVAFNSYVYTEDGREKEFVKRVVGVSGDRISIHDGFVYRNGEKLKEEYLAGVLTEGKMEEMVIEDAHVFVLGDNRLPGGSRDSRDPSIGQVALQDIKGKAILRLYPFRRIGLL